MYISGNEEMHFDESSGNAEVTLNVLP
jgi:hypothetical protein